MEGSHYKKYNNKEKRERKKKTTTITALKISGHGRLMGNGINGDRFSSINPHGD